MKHCPRCNRDLDESSFAKNQMKRDGLQGYCRECKKGIHHDYYGAHKEQWQQRSARQRESLREVVAKAKNRPCMDCDQTFPPYVMDFDHRGDKDGNVADMVQRSVSVQRLTTEIAKCDVVCANCHRIRTYGLIV